MRLLFISNDFPNPLEPTKAVFNLHLVRGLARNHQVEVISPVSWVDQWQGRGRGAHLPDGRKTVIDGVTVHYPTYYYPPKILRSRYGWFYWRSIRRTAARIIRENPPDAVLAYWVHPDGYGAIRAAKLAGVPSAVIGGGSDVQIITKDASRRKQVLDVLRSIDSVITVNRDLKSKITAMGIEEEKIHTWNQGVDERVFFPGDRVESRKRLGIADGPAIMLWVGRFVPVKGVEVMLDACSHLKNRGVDFRLYLVGDGPLRSDLEVDCWKRGLREKVIFAGGKPPEELGDFYRAADLFVMSSWSEGLPNVLRESLACGTPFVASRVGGIAEITGTINRLFPPGDASAMADQIMALLAEKRRVEESDRPLTWQQSAEDLVRIIASAKNSATAAEQATRMSPRQMLRRGMAAVLPRRMFLVHGSPLTNAVCLTFDDGPHPALTPKILDVLAEQHVKATFFVIGREAQQHPELIRRMAAEGHTIAHHSFSHSRPGEISIAALLEEIRQTDEVLRRAGANPAPMLRPPFGKVTAGTLWKLWREKIGIVLWNRDPKDFSGKSSDQMRRWLEHRPLRGGDVVLLHDTVAATADFLPELIKTTRAANLQFATVDQWTGEIERPETTQSVNPVST